MIFLNVVFVLLQDEETAMGKLKKNTHFNRMNQKSMKLLCEMAKNPETKKRLESKKVANYRMQYLVEKHKLRTLVQDTTDGGNEGKKTSLGAIIPQLVAAKRAETRMTSAIEEKRKTDELEMKELTVDVHNEDDGLYTKIDKGKSEKEEKAEVSVENETKAEDDRESVDNMYDDVANVLSVPKVEGDQWPEETNYAVASETADTLF